MKKIISTQTINNIYKKERRTELLFYIGFSVFWVILFVTRIIDNENPLIDALLCLFGLGFLVLMFTDAKKRKGKKGSYISETNYRIVEAYLVSGRYDPGSEEDILRFWCGETFGMLEATCSNHTDVISAKIYGAPFILLKAPIGRKFYVIPRYSIESCKYEVSLAFSADRYELDDNLKAKLTVVPEPENLAF